MTLHRQAVSHMQRAMHGRIPGVGPAGGCGRNSNRVVMQRPNG